MSKIYFCKCLNAKAIIEPGEEEDILYASLKNTVSKKSSEYSRSLVCKFCGDVYIKDYDPCLLKIIKRINT